jgi:hypothetical protein
MAGGSSLSIVAGLAVGIAFVVFFSTMHRIDYMLSDEELISKYSRLPEVQYFLEKYPDAKVEINRNPNEQYIGISFTTEKQVSPPIGFNSGIHTLGLSVTARPFHPVLDISCGLGGFGSVEPLENTGTIDFMEQRCFDPAGPDQRVIEVNYPGGTVGLFYFLPVQPEVIVEYPLLQSMMDEAKASNGAIISSNISSSHAATLLADQRLHFNIICFDGGGACSDELGSFIELGEGTGEYYVIRILGREASDGTQAETGAFAGGDIGSPIPVEVSNDGETSVEIIYNQD